MPQELSFVILSLMRMGGAPPAPCHRAGKTKGREHRSAVWPWESGLGGRGGFVRRSGEAFLPEAPDRTDEVALEGA